MKSVAVAVVALLVAAGAQAEQRRQPPPPSPGLTPVVPPGVVIPQTPLIPSPVPTPSVGSPFDARSGTYAPRYNDPNSRSRYGVGVPFYPGAIGIGAYAPASVPSPTPEQRPAAAPEPPRAPEPAPVPEAPKIAAAHPDTFYVIPGCYAGNRRPNPARLPKGCDASRLQEIPIR
jgi:hypothetical protein